MPSLETHQSSETTKLLLIGDSGSGKTGSLASLAKAGYNLRIVDMDNGLDVLASFLRGDSAALKRVVYETFTDRFKSINGRMMPRSAKAWSNAVKLFDHWKMPEREVNGKIVPAYDLGPIESWTPKDILVVDSLTFLSAAALRFIMSLNGRIAGPRYQSDWMEAQELVEQLLGYLYDDSIKCNVIVCSHITFIGRKESMVDDKGKKFDIELDQKGYPMTIGKALSPKVGRYFNSMLQVQTTGSGSAVRRYIHTQPTGMTELKNPNPPKVKGRYDITNGLAEFFKDVRS